MKQDFPARLVHSDSRNQNGILDICESRKKLTVSSIEAVLRLTFASRLEEISSNVRKRISLIGASSSNYQEANHLDESVFQQQASINTCDSETFSYTPYMPRFSPYFR